MPIRKVLWSQCECDWLKEHKDEPINQLAGYLGKTRYAINRKLAEILEGKVPNKKKGKSGKRTKIGKRPDCNNIFFRSAWEANVYRLLMLDKSIQLIQYEPTDFTFWQFGINKGTVSYTPDFKITYPNGDFLWLEIKGQLKPQDKTKIRRFIKFYPDEAKYLRAVTGSPKTKSTLFFNSINIPVHLYYNDLNKKYKNIISGWE